MATSMTGAGSLSPNLQPATRHPPNSSSWTYGDWQGRFDYELQGFFATLADRIFDIWPDPGGLGPAISDGMDAARKTRARQLLQQASPDATVAIDLARQGRNGEALKAWRALFGPKFPLS